MGVKVLDILFCAGEKIIGTENFVTLVQEAIGQMRSDKSGAACD
jgi:hypothetical protein